MGQKARVAQLVEHRTCNAGVVGSTPTSGPKEKIMNKTAIILAFILYVVISIGNLRQKDYPHALIWIAYSLSQLGFLWHEVQKDQ